VDQDFDKEMEDGLGKFPVATLRLKVGPLAKKSAALCLIGVMLYNFTYVLIPSKVSVVFKPRTHSKML